jgi:predicted DsbA family dithiol-disulfide isomerase
LDKSLVEQTLATNQYAANVQQDIAQAQQYGISGVPFFVLDNKYGVSGAQAVPVFLQTLQKAHNEWAVTNKPAKLNVINGDSCEIDGDC